MRVRASKSPDGSKPRALISVSDKTGMTDLAAGLAELGYEVISTGGSAKVGNGIAIARPPTSESSQCRRVEALSTLRFEWSARRFPLAATPRAIHVERTADEI